MHVPAAAAAQPLSAIGTTHCDAESGGHAADVSPDTQPALPAWQLSSLNTRRQRSL